MNIQAGGNLKAVINRHLSQLKKEVNAKEVSLRRVSKFDAEISTRIEGEEIWIGLRRA